MPYFNDEQEVYRYLGQLFLDLLADEELAPQFRTANTVVQYRYHKPESQITVKLLEDEDGQVDLGATQLEPEVIGERPHPSELAMDVEPAGQEHQDDEAAEDDRQRPALDEALHRPCMFSRFGSSARPALL